MTRIACSLLLLALVLLILPGSFFGCSEKLVAEAPVSGPNVVLQAFLSPPPEMASADRASLTVSAEDMDSIQVTLDIDGPIISGAVEVPVGTGRQFVITVEHVETIGGGASGSSEEIKTLLYRGETKSDVRADDVTELAVVLRPEVPLVKLTPKALAVDRGAGFYIDLKVYNLVGLTELMVEIDHNSSYNYILDPIAVVSPADRVDEYDIIGSGLDDGARYGIRVTSRTGKPPLVDSRGDATLARIFFVSDAFIVDTAGRYPITVDSVYATAPDSPFDSTFARNTEVTLAALVDHPVIIPDLNLRDVVIRQAGLQSPVDTIWYSDIDHVTGLGFGEGGVSDLTGIGELANLWNLWANANSITDLSPLASLARLQELDFGWCQVSDIGPLASIPSLRRVGMRGNRITDLTPLTRLPLLRYLGLSDNLITNIQPLVQNVNLGVNDTIDLQYNPLDDISLNTYIGALQSRKVTVYYGSPGSTPSQGGD